MRIGFGFGPPRTLVFTRSCFCVNYFFIFHSLGCVSPVCRISTWTRHIGTTIRLVGNREQLTGANLVTVSELVRSANFLPSVRRAVILFADFPQGIAGLNLVHTGAAFEVRSNLHGRFLLLS